MTKTKVILIVTFLLTFAAGTALGLFFNRSNSSKGHHSWLTEELDLTPDQADKMHKIWSEVMGASYKAQGDKRTAIAQERDQAVQALLTDEQKAQYDTIQKEYSRKMDELSQARKKTFDEAVARTKEILTPEQAKKYDELMKKQREGGPRHRRGAASSRATTENSDSSR